MLEQSITVQDDTDQMALCWLFYDVLYYLRAVSSDECSDLFADSIVEELENKGIFDTKTVVADTETN